jgi:hypothetical protein
VPATPPPIPTKLKKTPAEKAEALKKKVAKKATLAWVERFASALQTTVSLMIQHHLKLKKQPVQHSLFCACT